MQIIVFITLTSSFSNPLIYLATNITFREYTASTLRWIFCQSSFKVRNSFRGKVQSMQDTHSTMTNGKMMTKLTQKKLTMTLKESSKMENEVD